MELSKRIKKPMVNKDAKDSRIDYIQEWFVPTRLLGPILRFISNSPKTPYTKDIECFMHHKKGPCANKCLKQGEGWKKVFSEFIRSKMKG